MGRIKITVNGVTHTAEYTYSGLTQETIKTFNKTLAEGKIKRLKGVKK
jgi:hypothetical protein